MDMTMDKRYGRRSPLGVLIWGGKHARPLIGASRTRGRGAGKRGARTAARILGRLRRRFAACGALLLTAALVIGVSPSFRHYLQDNTTRELLAAARANTPLGIKLSDYVSSDGQEVPILGMFADAAVDGDGAADSGALPPAPRVIASQSAVSGEPEAPADVNEQIPASAVTSYASVPSAASTSATRTTTPKRVIQTLGVMSIPVIQMEMPIAEGAGTSELRYALGHHPVTPALGEKGYATVFGHRMYSYGRHFNRLDELLPGDVVQVTAGGRELNYIVDERITVLPEDVPYYMTLASDKARLLLVTCTPVRVASHRLLVFCTLEQDRTGDIQYFAPALQAYGE